MPSKADCVPLSPFERLPHLTPLTDGRLIAPTFKCGCLEQQTYDQVCFKHTTGGMMAVGNHYRIAHRPYRTVNLTDSLDHTSPVIKTPLHWLTFPQHFFSAGSQQHCTKREKMERESRCQREEAGAWPRAPIIFCVCRSFHLLRHKHNL